MAKTLKLSELRYANVQRCREVWHPIEDWSPAEWLMCLTGEVGELAGKLKHLKRGDTVPQKELGSEIADILIYLDLLAASLGLDLAQETIRKFNLVSHIEDSSYFVKGEEKDS